MEDLNLTTFTFVEDMIKKIKINSKTLDHRNYQIILRFINFNLVKKVIHL